MTNCAILERIDHDLSEVCSDPNVPWVKKRKSSDWVIEMDSSTVPLQVLGGSPSGYLT